MLFPPDYTTDFHGLPIVYTRLRPRCPENCTAVFHVHARQGFHRRGAMTIHRPDWERTVTIKAWTRGEKESLFTILAPPKDEGNGTLKKGREMWMFNPKVNRVIKLPPSMMSQSWMGPTFQQRPGKVGQHHSRLYPHHHRLGNA